MSTSVESSFISFMKSNKCIVNEDAFTLTSFLPDGSGRRLIAKRDLEEGTVLFTVPSSAILGPYTTTPALSKKLLSRFGSEGCWTGTIISMMYEYCLGSKSRWSAYFNILPERLCTPLNWSKSFDSKYFSGLDLPSRIGRDAVRSIYTSEVLPFIKKNPSIFGSHEQYTYALFQRMGDIVGSYSFTLNEVPEMVPMADLLNHSAGRNNARLMEDEPEKKMYTMQTICKVKKGEELFNTYGEIASDELLRRYGFVEPSNEDQKFLDEAELPLKFDDDAKFIKNSKKLLTKKQDIEEEEEEEEEEEDSKKKENSAKRIVRLRLKISNNKCNHHHHHHNQSCNHKKEHHKKEHKHVEDEVKENVLAYLSSVSSFLTMAGDNSEETKTLIQPVHEHENVQKVMKKEKMKIVSATVVALALLFAKQLRSDCISPAFILALVKQVITENQSESFMAAYIYLQKMNASFLKMCVKNPLLMFKYWSTQLACTMAVQNDVKNIVIQCLGMFLISIEDRVMVVEKGIQTNQEQVEKKPENYDAVLASYNLTKVNEKLDENKKLALKCHAQDSGLFLLKRENQILMHWGEVASNILEKLMPEEK